MILRGLTGLYDLDKTVIRFFGLWESGTVGRPCFSKAWTMSRSCYKQNVKSNTIRSIGRMTHIFDCGVFVNFALQVFEDACLRHRVEILECRVLKQSTHEMKSKFSV